MNKILLLSVIFLILISGTIAIVFHTAIEDYSTTEYQNLENELRQIVAEQGESCEDGIQNQDETGIDCGGVCELCARWIPKSNNAQSCEQLCASNELSSIADENGWICSSDERNRLEDSTPGTIVKWDYQRLRGNYYRNEGYHCYAVGQVEDADTTDFVDECYCG